MPQAMERAHGSPTPPGDTPGISFDREPLCPVCPQGRSGSHVAGPPPVGVGLYYRFVASRVWCADDRVGLDLEHPTQRSIHVENEVVRI